MFYWAEGGKKGFKVDFANCDENMICLFLRFLRTVYGIREDKLRVFIYSYSNQNPSALIDYWSEQTKIPKSQFSKPYVKVARDSRVHGKMERGLIHIRYSDMKLFLRLMGDLEEMIASL